ncbi:MAG: hypothetical protein QOI80_1044, partial [Solirubrobacteraceae bacterium]|nr:hypothetical protein [Solirubrobacteraceae bacterium]
MPKPLKTLPDVLVLGAGGTLGIAWLRGIVTGIEESTGLDLRGCDYFVGTSAGAFVAARLAAGKRVEDPGVVHDVASEPHGDTEDPSPPTPLQRAAMSSAR